MPDDKKDLLDELAEMGLDAEIIDRIKNWNDASPLRRAAKSHEKRAETAEQELSKYRSMVIKTAFKEAGIGINPDLLQLPSDLDFTDSAAVTKWATDNGLKSTGPSVDQEELESHEAMTELASGGDSQSSSVITPIQAAEWDINRSMKFAASHPDAWEQLKRGQEVRGVSVPT